MTRSAYLLVLVACGCAAATSSTGAPPTEICGTTLDESAAGAVVWDATGASGRPPIVTAPSSSGIFIRVAQGCDTGATVSWTPRNQARLIGEADAADGRPVVVVLSPASRGSVFTVSASRDGKQVASLRVDLSRGETPLPTRATRQRPLKTVARHH